MSPRFLWPLWGLLVLTFGLAGCQNNGAKRMYDQAMHQWEEGRYEEAVQNLVALTTAYPDDSLVDDSVFWVANIYQHYLKNPVQAIRYYRSLTKGFENSEYYYPSMIGLADAYSSQDKESKRKAILIYHKLQESPLGNEEFEKIQLKLAELYFEFEQYEQARVELKKLILHSPGSPLDPKAYHLIGYSYYLEGSLDMAELAFKETEKKFGYSKTSLSSAMSLADLYEDQDKLSEAISVYSSIMSRLENKEIFYQLAGSRIAKLKTRLKQTNKG